MTQSTLTATMQRLAVTSVKMRLTFKPLRFSNWIDLGLGAATPLLPLPRQQVSDAWLESWGRDRVAKDHILFVVDVRLLAGGIKAPNRPKELCDANYVALSHPKLA